MQKTIPQDYQSKHSEVSTMNSEPSVVVDQDFDNDFWNRLPKNSKHLIRVNGYTINPANVAMLERRHIERKGELTGKTFVEDGIYIVFNGGGLRWIADPEAKAVEQAFMEYDGVQERPELPYLA